ncbi:MAG: M14 family zinc carboxypeptidase [Candidatus Odinarchaeota archaeon]
MELREILDQIPDYKEFMTVAELNASSKKLANEFSNVDLKEIGKSKEGHTIYCLKIGEGEKNALLYAFPHPNEPIGSMSQEFLSYFLAEHPDFTKDTSYTWYLIKAIDIDGAILNEGWFKGDFNPLKYAKNYYRPATFEQVDWAFPVKYKKLSFNSPLPETRALMEILNEIKPKFLYSFHNSSFGGVYFYISREIGNLYADLTNLVTGENLPIHLGEPEISNMKKLHDGFFQCCGVQEIYDSLEVEGIENPQQVIKYGTSSFDYYKNIAGEDSFSMTCEIPYFYDKNIGDPSPTDIERKELRLESLEYIRSMYKHSKKVFRSIRKYCRKNTRIYTVVKDYLWRRGSTLNLQIHEANTSPYYHGKATVAQAFDLNVSKRWYDLLYTSMITRLCDEAIMNHPENKDELTIFKKNFENWIEQKLNEILSKTKFEVIPLQKLVRIQVGSVFIALKHL